jgi:hypothetical protein
VVSKVGVAGVEAAALREHHPAPWVEPHVGHAAAMRAVRGRAPLRADASEAYVVEPVLGQQARRHKTNQIVLQRRPWRLRRRRLLAVLCRRPRSSLRHLEFAGRRQRVSGHDGCRIHVVWRQEGEAMHYNLTHPRSKISVAHRNSANS